MTKEQKTQLEVGDKLRRFEVGLSREIDCIHTIVRVTKTLAFTENGHTVLRRELNFNSTRPKNSKYEFVGEAELKKVDYSTPRYFLIKQ